MPEAAAANDDWAVDALIEYTCVLVAQRLRDKELYRMAQEQWADTVGALRDEIRRTRQNPVPKHRIDWWV